MADHIQILDAAFAQLLAARKSEYVSNDNGELVVCQQGMARIKTDGFPGWVDGLESAEPVIETYVASADGISATSDNQPFVDAWIDLVTWMDGQVRTALRDLGIEVTGDAYVTASLTETGALEGLAHMDDDTFMPNAPVGIVAIIGQWTGPRVATATVAHEPLRPMSQVIFDEATRASFESDQLAHAASKADQLVIFAQFGQLHAGPTAEHVSHLGKFRQLIVYRGHAALS